jgi:hypothetical protein
MLLPYKDLASHVILAEILQNYDENVTNVRLKAEKVG